MWLAATRSVIIGRTGYNDDRHLSIQAAVDILVKHSAETTDRPRAIAASEMLSQGFRILMTPAGERLKKYRR